MKVPFYFKWKGRWKQLIPAQNIKFINATFMTGRKYWCLLGLLSSPDIGRWGNPHLVPFVQFISIYLDFNPHFTAVLQHFWSITECRKCLTAITVRVVLSRQTAICDSVRKPLYSLALWFSDEGGAWLIAEDINIKSALRTRAFRCQDYKKICLLCLFLSDLNRKGVQRVWGMR